MSVNFNWTITELQCYPQHGDYNNVVYQVHWQCVGTQDVDGSVYSKDIRSTTEISFSGSSNFISYNDITEEIALSWIWSNGVKKDLVESIVEQQINEQINPSSITLPLPWTSVEVTPTVAPPVDDPSANELPENNSPYVPPVDEQPANEPPADGINPSTEPPVPPVTDPLIMDPPVDETTSV